jgi:NTE family protein
VSVSGGGTRAATLGRAVLLGLNQYRMSDGHTLADNIIAVSAVSGGAMTAAAFVADGVGGLGPSFRQNVLKKNLENIFLKEIFLDPSTWSNRASSFESFFDTAFLYERRYSDLSTNRDAPFLFLNTTDIVSGRTFTFSQQQMADLCADLNPMKLSIAVAAAGNFPFASTDIEFKNYQSGSPACDDPTPGAVDVNLPYADLRATTETRYRNQMRLARPGAEPSTLARPIEWLHLFDGGLADNLGVRPIIRVLTREMLSELARNGVDDIILVQVNARSDPPEPKDTERGSPKFVSLPPGDSDLVVETSYGPIDRVTALSTLLAMEHLDAIFASWPAGQRPFPQKLYPIIIDFDELQDPILRDKVKSIETQTALNDDLLQKIEKAGRTLLAQDPCFHAFVSDAREREAVVYIPNELDNDHNNFGSASIDIVAAPENCKGPLAPGKLSLPPGGAIPLAVR